MRDSVQGALFELEETMIICDVCGAPVPDDEWIRIEIKSDLDIVRSVVVHACRRHGAWRQLHGIEALAAAVNDAVHERLEAPIQGAGGENTTKTTKDTKGA